MSKARGESGLMEGCRLCGSVTSGHDNKKFYEMIELAVDISCNRSQKINYLMKLAVMTAESADGCAEDYEHISDAIKATEGVFERIKELIKNPNN